MTDTATPAYPVDACNENGPYPQDVAIRWASYEGSANTPDDGGGGTAAAFTLTTTGLRLKIDLAGADAGAVYVVSPGDQSGTYPSMTAMQDGSAHESYDYAAAGSYHVVIGDAAQNVVHDETVSVSAAAARRTKS